MVSMHKKKKKKKKKGVILGKIDIQSMSIND